MSEKEIQRIFSENLKRLFYKQDKTQIELAKYLGVSNTTVNNYVKGYNMPRMDKIDGICRFFGISRSDLISDLPAKEKGLKIPVLGKIIAGVPIEAITDILDYEEIDKDMALRGDFFALKVTGRSMEPTIKENDIVIVRQQPDVENGEIAVVMVNGNEATLKRIRIQADGIWLMPDNPAACAAKFYTGEEIATLPVAIIGKVIELRRNF